MLLLAHAARARALSPSLSVLARAAGRPVQAKAVQLRRISSARPFKMSDECVLGGGWGLKGCGEREREGEGKGKEGGGRNGREEETER